MIAKEHGLGYARIDQYGVIGDLHTAALIGLDGSIDWLCLPRFDSPSVFAAILDYRIGGFFRLSAASKQVVCRQLYVPDSNVLITRFQAPEGVGEVQDCMPIEADRPGERAKVHQIIRTARAVRGTVIFDLECRPAFDYGRADHTVSEIPDGVLFTSNDSAGTRLALLGSQPLEIVDGGARARIVLDENQTAVFQLR